MHRILLIGFRATGKSTVGALLARKLGWPFEDLDQFIEKRLERSIREIVETQGWKAFREAEREAMRTLAERKPLVLALGGGAVSHEEEMSLLKEGALVVWLTAPVEVILERLRKDPRTTSQRPALTEMDWETEVRTLLSEREPLYARWADLKISTQDLSPEEISRLIVEKLQP